MYARNNKEVKILQNQTNLNIREEYSKNKNTVEYIFFLFFLRGLATSRY